MQWLPSLLPSYYGVSRKHLTSQPTPLAIPPTALVNLPLHYAFLAQRFRQLEADSPKPRAVPVRRTLERAFYNTCHPLLMTCFGVYAFYAFTTYLRTLQEVVGSINLQQPGHLPGSGVVRLAVANVVLNYAMGMLAFGGCWLWFLGRSVWRVGRRAGGCCRPAGVPL